MRMQVTALALDDVYGTAATGSRQVHRQIKLYDRHVGWTPGIVEECAKERNADYDGGQSVSTSTS